MSRDDPHLWHCINRLTHIVATMHEMNLMPLGVQAESGSGHISPEEATARLQTVTSRIQQVEKQLKDDKTKLSTTEAAIKANVKAGTNITALQATQTSLKAAIPQGESELKTLKEEKELLKKIVDADTRLKKEKGSRDALEGKELAARQQSESQSKAFETAQLAVK